MILLNTSILTEYGAYRYAPLSGEEARGLVREQLAAGREVVSAVSHLETAALMTELLEFPVEVCPASARQAIGDVALIFKLRGRVTHRRLLSRREVEEIGYDFGLLTRTE